MPEQKSHLFAFWAEYNLTNSGRDPLGIRNSSAVIFSTLLPGLTSVTKRIRLYGFYPWILQHFYETHETQNREKQMVFIRRCEVLLSFIMASRRPRVAGMDGNSYADNLLDSHADKEGVILDIHSPARFYKSGETNATYYQARGGVLDVVYAGSLINLGLVARLQEVDNLLVPTKAGIELASAFDSSISGENNVLFFQSVEDGHIHVDQLAGLLTDFDLVKDIRGTEEWKAYKKLLTGTDFGHWQTKETWFRRANIRQYLRLYQISPIGSPAREYPGWFLRNGPIMVENSSREGMLWYMAELSESIHYCQEAIFWCILQILDRGDHRIPITHFADNFAHQALESLFPGPGQTNRNETLGEWVSTLIKNHPEKEDILNALRKKDLHRVMGASLVCWYSLYSIHSVRFPALEACSRQQGLSGHLGDLFRDHKHFFLSWKDHTLEDAFRRLCLGLINQHMEVAFAKMNQGRNNVLRITVEDNCLIKLAPDYPAQVANRVYQFHGFLSDMRFIDPQGLTAEGEKLLNELSHDQDPAC